MSIPITMHLRFFLAALALLAGGAVRADTIVPQQTRAPTAAELAGFAAFYAKTYPEAPAPAAQLEVRRFNDKDEWNVMGAMVDSAPRRGARALCIVNRVPFVFAKGWKQEGAARQLAWLEAAGCTRKDAAIAVLKRLPESDIVELLEQQAGLLAGARLLFAGNTQCARQRANAFALKSIDLGAAVHGTEEMAGLRYHDDRGGSATVWVRRSGREHSAWNVSCAPVQ